LVEGDLVNFIAQAGLNIHLLSSYYYRMSYCSQLYTETFY
jgi:hypothetical protein